MLNNHSNFLCLFFITIILLSFIINTNFALAIPPPPTKSPKTQDYPLPNVEQVPKTPDISSVEAECLSLNDSPSLSCTILKGKDGKPFIAFGFANIATMQQLWKDVAERIVRGFCSLHSAINPETIMIILTVEDPSMFRVAYCSGKMTKWMSIGKDEGEEELKNEGNRETWLNGWTRQGRTVLIGTVTHCAGCGKREGIICVVFPEDYIPPEKNPDWQFNEDDCPVNNH